MFPHEPSPLLGMYRKNYELYSSMVNDEETKNNKLLDKKSKKVEKNKINNENDKINIKHKIEKHYGRQKDCPLCLSLMEKIEGKENINESSKKKSVYRKK